MAMQLNGISTAPTATKAVAGPSRARSRVKRRKKAPLNSSSAPIIDLTGEDEEQGEVRFLGGEELEDAISVAQEGSPSASKAGISGPSSPGPYTPVAFTPLTLRGGRKRAAAFDGLSTSSTTLESSDVEVMPDVGMSTKRSGDNRKREEEHFDPTALFGTSMMPEPVAPRESSSGAAQFELRPVAEAIVSASSSINNTGTGLLLPANVMLESDSAPEEQGEASSSPMEGVHFLDDQVTRGVQRYFDPSAPETTDEQAAFLATADQAKICKRCKRPGHHARDCTHVMCHLCGAMDEHERKDCPMGLVCFNCGQRGHKNTDCTQSRAGSSRHGCTLCGDGGHLTGNCPTVWRTYIYLATSQLEACRATRETYKHWYREAAGGLAAERWCYNCAREGHLGDDCSRRRGSLARVTFASAFSAEVADAGPHGYARAPAKPAAARGTHLHFDDEYELLEGEAPEFAGFDAGRKGKQKAKRKLQELERGLEEAEDEDDDEDEEDWFNSRGRGSGTDSANGGANFRPANARIMSIRSTATPASSSLRGAGRGGKPWDSTPRRHPFSVVGLPTSAPGKPRGHMPDVDSPSVRGAGARARGRGAQSSVLHSIATTFKAVSTPGNAEQAERKRKPLPELHANGTLDGIAGNPEMGLSTPKHLDSNLDSLSVTGAGTGTARRARKKRAAAGTGGAGDLDVDWEGEWRRSGAGGGNVASWGGEMDLLERDGKQDKAGKGKGKGKGQADGGKGKGTGGKGTEKGAAVGVGVGVGKARVKVKGQRYTGGY